jgi:hypothetical protein
MVMDRMVVCHMVSVGIRRMLMGTREMSTGGRILR